MAYHCTLFQVNEIMSLRLTYYNLMVTFRKTVKKLFLILFLFSWEKVLLPLILSQTNSLLLLEVSFLNIDYILSLSTLHLSSKHYTP